MVGLNVKVSISLSAKTGIAITINRSEITIFIDLPIFV